MVPTWDATGSSSSHTNTVESDHPRDTQRRMTEAINWWFRNTPERSWAKLAEAVETMGGYAVLAERLRQKMSQG